MGDSIKMGVENNADDIVVAHGRNFRAYRDNYDQQQQQKSGEAKDSTQKPDDGVSKSDFHMMPVEFHGLHLQNIITSNDFVTMINTSFGNIFPDFYAGRVFPNPRDPREIVAEVAFSPRKNMSKPPENMIFALSEVGKPNKEDNTSGDKKFTSKDVIKRMSNLNRNIGHKYEFTEAAKKAFAPMINKKFYLKKLDQYNKPMINWKQIITETSMSPVIGANPILLYVFPIDIIAFCREYWGNTDKDGHPVHYMVEPYQPLPNQYTGQAAYPNPEGLTWLFQVTQINDDAVYKVFQTMGMNTNQNGFIPYRRA